MNSLISINNKFMNIEPRKLVEMIYNSKYTKGLEIYVNNKPEELKYLDDLVFELKKYNLILQVHGEVTLSFFNQVKFMKKLEQYSDYLGYPIVVTLHSIFDNDIEVSIKKTNEYIGDLIQNIDSNKIIIALENLNCLNGVGRLNKELIRPLVLNDEKLYFTYDIGHDIADYGNVLNLDDYMIEDIRNIHLHSNDGKGNDHQPIKKNDLYWNQIIKALIFLQNNHYKYNIVYEYDPYACYGETMEEKTNSYLDSIDTVSEHYL